MNDAPGVLNRFVLALLLFALTASCLYAQPANPPPVPGQPAQDPLMTLMLSQPKIDVDSPVEATAAFDPPTVGPGQTSTYRVTFNALEQSIDWPEKLAAPPGLELRQGAHGQMLSMAGAVLQPRTSFNYRARPSGPGQFTVPGFTVTVYGKPVNVPAARLGVLPAPAAALPAAQRLTLELPNTNLFVGQPSRVVVRLPGYPGGVLAGLSQVQLTGDGFLVDQANVRQRFEVPPSSGAPTAPTAGSPGARPGTPNNIPTFIYETTLTPIKAGKLSVFAQAFTAGNRFSTVITSNNGAVVTMHQPQYTLLDSEPLELRVQPLPRGGQLPGFTGAIGKFSLAPPQLSTNLLRVGDTVRLTVKVLGDTNSTFVRLVPPPPPASREWQVFPAAPDSQSPQLLQLTPAEISNPELSAFTTLNYVLVPLTEQAQATPAIPFSYFDPQRGVYADLTIPPVPVTVEPGLAPTDLQALLQADSLPSNTETEPALSDLAPRAGLMGGNLVPVQRRSWFPLVQLAPATVFLGLVGWDRRRRYLEQHPDLLLRRRARRALRRQRRALRKAAREGDATRFALAAASALRVACAPHYPAEPRALVGADVLRLLPQTERADGSGEAVQQVFRIVDAARFAPAPADAAGLLARQPEIEHVLDQLEERLCE